MSQKLQVLKRNKWITTKMPSFAHLFEIIVQLPSGYKIKSFRAVKDRAIILLIPKKKPVLKQPK